MKRLWFLAWGLLSCLVHSFELPSARRTDTKSCQRRNFPSSQPFLASSANKRLLESGGIGTFHFKGLQLWMTQKSENDENINSDIDKPILSAAPLFDETPLETIGKKKDDDDKALAAMGTINERLLADLKRDSEQASSGNKWAQKFSILYGNREQKTPEERQAALEEARNLNGINPLVALSAGVFALAMAWGMWWVTNQLGEYFAFHPLNQDDFYIFVRAATIYRNIVMGFASLASGFFGVTGLGILGLGIRVSYGVLTGELDPTPIRKSNPLESPMSSGVELPNIWDLMTNKRPKRKKRGDNDLYGPPP